MQGETDIQVRDVEEGCTLRLALHHTVLTIRFKSGGTDTTLDIPVECLRLTRLKRVNVLWVAAFLAALVLGLIAGIPLALWSAKTFDGGKGTGMMSVPIIVTSLLPACYFFFRIWHRDPVVVLSFGEDKNAKFSFWMPLRKTRRDTVETLLSATEALQPDVAGCKDHAVIETDPSTSSVRSFFRWLNLVFVFSVPAIVTERVWLFGLVLLPLAGTLVAGARRLRAPPLLRQTACFMKRHQWEEALRCLDAYVAEDAGRKGACLMDRLMLLRRLGRFDEAAEVIDAHLGLLGPEAHRDLTDEIASARRVRQRKVSPATGGWFLTNQERR